MTSLCRGLAVAGAIWLASASPVFAECTAQNTRPASEAALTPDVCLEADLDAGEVVVSWPLGPDIAGRLWTLTAIGPPDEKFRAVLVGPDGAHLTTSDRIDPDGRLVIADLGLPAGGYEVRLRGAGAGIVTVELGDAGPHDGSIAAEPDDRAGQASTVVLDMAVAGRLYGVRTSKDTDIFELSLDAETFLDAVLEGPPDITLKLALVDQSGGVVQERSGDGAVSLVDLGLGAGRHRFRITGTLAADQRYRFVVRDRGTPAPEQEIEPNDEFDLATRMGETLRGRLTERDEDFLRFDVSGEPQLWRFQAIGDEIGRLSIHDTGGTVIARAAKQDEERFVRLSNLLLAPGSHVISITGQPGDYVIRAIPLGPPPEPAAVVATDPPADPATLPLDAHGVPITDEVEPNDTLDRAELITFGQRRTGMLDRQGDHDFYSFHLAAETRVQLRLSADPEIGIYADLLWGASETRVDRITVSPGASGPAIWDGILPYGDYSLSLHGSTSVPRPYALELLRQPYFDRPRDLESNDSPSQAVLLHADGRYRGTIHSSDDEDWLLLPMTEGETSLNVVRAGGQELPVRLELHELIPPGDDAFEGSLRTRRRASVADLPAEGWSVPMAGGAAFALRVTGAIGPYDLQLEFGESGAVSPSEAPPPVGLALELDATTIAAFSRVSQTVGGVLSLHATAPVTLSLGSHVEDARWRLHGLPEQLEHPGSGIIELPVRVEIPPDAWDAEDRAIAVAAEDQDGRIAWAEAFLRPEIAAAEVRPEFHWPIPDPLLGGINVGAAYHGAEASLTERGTPLEFLIDDIVNHPGTAKIPFSRFPENGILIDLAGDDLHAVRGLVLRHVQDGSYISRLKTFSVSVSPDGQTFAPAGSFEMSLGEIQQAFVFDRPVEARFVRIDPISTHLPGTSGGLALDEVQVVAGPRATTSEPQDIAASSRGGQMVHSTPYFAWSSMQTPGSRASRFRALPPDSPTVEMVTAFRFHRAALIDEVVWHDDPAVEPGRRAALVRVERSLTTPVGPWETLGEFQPGDGGPSSLRFDDPHWARYLRFRVFAQSGERFLQLASRVEVFEHPVSEDYRSILGIWGEGRREAFHELQGPEAPATRTPDSNDTPETADPLTFGRALFGDVSLGADDDWFRIEVPESGGFVTVTLEASPVVDAVAALFDAGGTEIPMMADNTQPNLLTYSTRLDQGVYHLRVSEVPRSVVVAWDTSGSVSAFVPAIVRAIRRFSQDVVPGREAVNFVPFNEPPEALLTEWAEDTTSANAALHGYDPRDYRSSNAEIALLEALEQLRPRDGVKAVVILTDSVSSGRKLTPQLWEAIREIRPRIFTMTVPTGGSDLQARLPAMVMRDWALAGGGFNRYLGGQSTVETAFRRVAAWLRRPAPYRVTAGIDTTPPEPGALLVNYDPHSTTLSSGAAVEVILDASGSMLKRLDGERRIAIAKRVLGDLVRESLPASVPFALRVFGQGEPGSCDTNLQVPLAPLDADAVLASIEAIWPTNLAKTPIGAALSHVADDLGEANGTGLVILLTDGEETCDGDPAAEIEKLRARGFDVQVNIVGFAIDDADLEETFARWAALGNGSYFSAVDAASLEAAMLAAISPRFEVLLGDRVIGGGWLNSGDPVSLDAGTYTLRIPGRSDIDVFVQSGETTIIDVAEE